MKGKNTTSKWLHNDDPALKAAVFELFDQENNQLQGLLNVLGFIKSSGIPDSDIGNIFFWMISERGITEACLDDFDSIIRKAS